MGGIQRSWRRDITNCQFLKKTIFLGFSPFKRKKQDFQPFWSLGRGTITLPPLPCIMYIYKSFTLGHVHIISHTITWEIHLAYSAQRATKIMHQFSRPGRLWSFIPCLQLNVERSNCQYADFSVRACTVNTMDYWIRQSLDIKMCIVHALTQKLSSILPITYIELELKTNAFLKWICMGLQKCTSELVR